MSRTFKRIPAKVSTPDLTQPEADDLLRAYRAHKRHEREVRTPRWKLAQAGSDRRLLIGNSQVFKSPERQYK